MFLTGRESLIVPYLNVPDRYHSYTNYFLLVADFFTDKANQYFNFNVLRARAFSHTLHDI